MRLLVTGSRNWTDIERLHHVLDNFAELFAKYQSDKFVQGGLILVSGHARQGVDRMAEDWYADRFPLETPELWRADWKRYGKRAGFIRNVAMVDTRPDLCVAFIARCDKEACVDLPMHGTHGTTHCADYARAQDVQVTRYYSTPELGVAAVKDRIKMQAGDDDDLPF